MSRVPRPWPSRRKTSSSRLLSRSTTLLDSGRKVPVAAQHFAEDPGVDGFAQYKLAGEHVADRADDAFGRFLFHHITARAGVEGAFGVDQFVVRGIHEHRHLGPVDLQVFEEVDAADPAQGNIDNRQVKRVAARRWTNASAALAAVGGHGEVWFVGFKQFCEAMRWITG